MSCCASTRIPVQGLKQHVQTPISLTLCMGFDYCKTVLQKEDAEGQPTKSAHPARFSPDDKFSRERVTLKKRFGILPTQLPPQEY